MSGLGGSQMKPDMGTEGQEQGVLGWWGPIWEAGKKR